MKRLLFIIGLLFTITIIPVRAQNKKENRFEKEFQKTLALVNSDKFIVKFYIATPTVQTLFTPPGAGNNIDIDPKNCYLWVQDSLVKANLPYFGEGSVKSGSQLDTISFQNILFSRTVKVYWEGKKKAIAYQLTIMSGGDVYYLNMHIQYDGTCYLYFSDRRRSPISYVGQIVKQKTGMPSPEPR